MQPKDLNEMRGENIGLFFGFPHYPGRGDKFKDPSGKTLANILDELPAYITPIAITSSAHYLYNNYKIQGNLHTVSDIEKEEGFNNSHFVDKDFMLSVLGEAEELCLRHSFFRDKTRQYRKLILKQKIKFWQRLRACHQLAA